MARAADGAPGETRTPDPLVRSQMLYPAELRAQRFYPAPIPDQLSWVGRFAKPTHYNRDSQWLATGALSVPETTWVPRQNDLQVFK